MRILLANPRRALGGSHPYSGVKMESGAATGQRPLGTRRRHLPAGHLHGGAGGGGVQRLRRIALVAAAVALIPATISYLETISGPSNSSVGIRTVEWLRGHGAAGLVSKVGVRVLLADGPSKGRSDVAHAAERGLRRRSGAASRPPWRGAPSAAKPRATGLRA